MPQHQPDRPKLDRGDQDAERRRSERFVAMAPIALHRRGDRQRRGRTFDIAERGVLVNVRAPVEPGTHLNVQIEVDIPMRVRLGFAADSLVIDGPSVSHLACVPGLVRRCTACHDGTWELGIEFADGGDAEDRRIVETYLDHLRDDHEYGH